MYDSKDKRENILAKIISQIFIALSIEGITQIFKFIAKLGIARIEVTEWDNSYFIINKILYNLNSVEYDKYKLPTTNKNKYELTDGTVYFIKLPDKNFIKVSCYEEKESKLFTAKHLVLIFMGKQRHKYREKFIKESLNFVDKNHITVQYMNEIKCDIIPHSFDNIVLDSTIKNNIINGLTNWVNSKEWYRKHQLVYKIGVLLYGKPGTGKSTVAKAISTMFGNAPIFTIDPNNIMNSISNIISMRKKYNSTIIVLIEDFDMYFKKRDEEDNENMETETEKEIKKCNNKKQDDNQNAIFQLLDGIYSTDDTIYIATTNYKNKLDSALVRYGRFDIQEELDYFDEAQALDCVKLLDYDKDVLNSMNLTYPVQPSYLQSKIMEYRANTIKYLKEEGK